jgi:putative nucleotidyltransferase with HDIG domain
MPDATPPDAGVSERREGEREPLAPKGPEAAERFLRAIAKVLRDRTLYPEHHPQALAGLAALREAIGDLFLERDERMFVVIDDQVFVDDRLLGGRGKGSADLAGVLRDSGVEVLTVRRGLTPDEMLPLLDVLATFRAAESGKPCFRSGHIALGDVAVDNAAKPLPGAIRELGAAISRTAQASFADETKLLRDTYLDWTTVQQVLVSHVDRIMGAIEKNLFANFHSFIPLAELKSYDEYTYVHAINLAILTMAQAESLGFSKDAVHGFGLGALLHDVGKTQVSVEVLHKAGKLTPEEAEEMKTHPVHGATMILQHREIPRVAAIVAYEHHLKFNGAGYPAMTRQRPPHIASRLVAVSDHFDAMRSNRPYRDAMEPAQIFEIMQNNKGTELDPVLVDHFFAMMKSRAL